MIKDGKVPQIMAHYGTAVSDAYDSTVGKKFDPASLEDAEMGAAVNDFVKAYQVKGSGLAFIQRVLNPPESSSMSSIAFQIRLSTVLGTVSGLAVRNGGIDLFSTSVTARAMFYAIESCQIVCDGSETYVGRQFDHLPILESLSPYLDHQGKIPKVSTLKPFEENFPHMCLPDDLGKTVLNALLWSVLWGVPLAEHASYPNWPDIYQLIYNKPYTYLN